MVRKRKDGLWEGNTIIGHKKDGKPIYKTIFARTQKELTDKLHDLIEEYRGVDLCENSRMTLSEWSERWLDQYVSMRIRPTTVERYRRQLCSYVLPYIGKKQMLSITREDVQRLYNTLLEKGRKSEDKVHGKKLSPSCVRSVHMVLHEAMKDAQKERLIPSNPTEGLLIPKATPGKMNVLNTTQLDTFMDAIKQEPYWYDFFYTEITTGLRKGEICALKWEDFDEREGSLKIRRSMSVGKGGAIILSDPKTSNSERTVYLPDTTAELLRARNKGSVSEWIFPSLMHYDRPTSPSTALETLKKILKKAGLPDLRFHDLRHTFATHAQANGVDVKTLSAILGHASAAFTLDRYTHVTGEMQQHAAEVVGTFITDIFGGDLKPWAEEKQEAEAYS